MARQIHPMAGARRLRSSLGFPCALAGLLLAGCVSTGEPAQPVDFAEPLAAPVGAVELVEGAPGESAPADVWVAPVIDATTEREVPSAALRDELYRGLVGRLYSPLALGFGDVARVEAGDGAWGSAKSTGAAQGVLLVEIERWDTAQLEARGTIDAAAKVRLVDLRAEPPVQVFGRRIGRRLELESSLLEQATPAELGAYAARNLAAELLSALPRRVPSVPSSTTVR